MKKQSGVIKALQGIGGVILMGGLFYLGSGSLIPAPTYAVAYINPENHTYLTPPCLHEPETRPLQKSTIGEVYKADLHLSADPDCREQEGFFQEGRSGLGTVLEKIGIFSPLKSRWNSDGNWNW